MTLTADPSAPTAITPEMSAKLAKSKSLLSLSAESRALTKRLQKRYGSAKYSPDNDPDSQRKQDVDAALHRLKNNKRNQLLEKARRRHFRNADTHIIEGQSTAIDDVKSPLSPQYDVHKRAEVVRLTCESSEGSTDTDMHRRRVQAIEARIALCTRQESRHRNQRPSKVEPARPETNLEATKARDHASYPLICKPKQCIFCLGNDRKSYEGRTFEYSRVNKALDEMDRHLKCFQPTDEVACPHPSCQAAGVVLSSKKVFKIHAKKVHRIDLRA